MTTIGERNLNIFAINTFFIFNNKTWNTEHVHHESVALAPDIFIVLSV